MVDAILIKDLAERIGCESAGSCDLELVAMHAFFAEFDVFGAHKMHPPPVPQTHSLAPTLAVTISSAT